MKARLSSEEREALRTVANLLVEPRKVEAVCAYGSTVAGYAREDSDYDVIIVVKNFRGGVRYRYLEAAVPASALIVDEELLMGDAREAALGEFVIGRLLNVYEPIAGAEFLNHLEIQYKRRVISEELYELASDYGEFSQDLAVPYDYFLFDKLRKRALVYPPALYSYAQTYSGKSGEENREFAVRGFREAAHWIGSRRYLTIDDSSIRISSVKLRGDAFSKALSLFSMTTRGVTQYAVHGYAGRVGLGVFKKEALSKLKRMRERPELPRELERPRSLLKLDDGALFEDGSSVYDGVAKLSGMNDGFKVKESQAGDLSATARIVTLSEGSRETKILVKHFSDVRSLKWALLGIWALSARKFSLSPLSRLHREYHASRRLRELGVKTPRVIGVAPDERILVKEYVEGEPLSRVIHRLLRGWSDDATFIKSYAEAIAKIHRGGFTLGDTKASNVIIRGGEVFLTDLEQAVESGEAAWDIAEFLYYTAKLSLRAEGMERVARTFLEAYRNENGSRAIATARKLRYVAPFQPFLAPSMTLLIRNLLREYS